MNQSDAINALAALGQATRLETFRLLVQHQPKGLPAGELARTLNVPQNTLSAHLSVLSQAGLVQSERQSRSIIYRADLTRFGSLVSYLFKDCCGGRADICAPLLTDLASCNSKDRTCA